MTLKSGPLRLDATPLIMGPDGQATPKPFTPKFFAELDAEFDGFAGHILIMTFSFDEPWPTWEIHPRGDEFVYLVSGDTDFILRSADGDRTLRVKEPGSYVVVPRGTWHTARPHAPTTMLFVTPGQGTENRETPG